MPSVFPTQQSYNGAFRADQLSLSFGGFAATGYLIQSAQFSYNQQVTMLYELGSANIYYVGGRAQGTATLSQVVGPSALSKKFIQLFNDICSPQSLGLTTQNGCPKTRSAEGALNYTLKDAVLTSIGASIAAADNIINEQMQFMFANLDDTASA